jgi:hypothetical protein
MQLTAKLLLILLAVINVGGLLSKSVKKIKRQRAFSYFSNVIDSADAESYGTTLFDYLNKYLVDIKQQQQRCNQIPLPKTVLNQRYFNPMFNLRMYKYWYPPKDYQYLIVWSQLESYRNAMLLSYLLQNENAKFPPGDYLSVCVCVFGLFLRSNSMFCNHKAGYTCTCRVLLNCTPCK